MGRVVVHSALGEPLRADIDVPEVTAEEAASLRVSIGSPEAYRAAGMELTGVAASVNIVLQRSADGRAFLRVTSTRPVTEPFMDLIIDANWSSGRVVRDYTMLFDPPNLRPAPAPLPPVSSSGPAQRPAAPVVTPARTAATGAPSTPATPTRPAERRAPAEAARPDGSTEQLVVKAGDTAGRIAEAHRPADVSLDQMLVAMLRSNPQAFIGGNVNRIKAGAVLNLPGAAAAAAIPAAEARQTIVSQSRDFNEFRRRLASAAAPAAVAAADRQASGQIQAEVEDRKPAATAQDKLTLTKPGSSEAEEARIAQERQKQETETRVAELSRNVEELSKLAPPAAATAAPSVEASSATPAAPAQQEAAAPATPSAVEVAASAPAATDPSAAPPAAPAEPTPAAAAPAAPKPAPAPAPQEPSFMASLTDNPLLLPAAGGLLALLAGFGFYRMRQRQKNVPVDSSFLESRLQPDSFFGSSGGQRIDTTDASVSGSSMVYSPSQLDAAGDVDPVAEADVYLAYGRDLQAEEILKEAMRSTPTRVAIHNKLLEIYAKRRDTRAFEVVATEAYSLTQGQGPEWEHACSLGQELDPGNPLYQAGGKPAGMPMAAAATGAAAAYAAPNTVPFDASTLGQDDALSAPGDLDLDLDLGLGSDEPAAPESQIPAAAVSRLDDLVSTDALTGEPAVTDEPVSSPMDFDLDFPSDPAPLVTAVDAPQAPTFDPVESLDILDLQDSLPVPLDDVPASDAAVTSAPAAGEMLSFDLDEINLDLTPPAEAPAAHGADTGEAIGSGAENPLETKLSLAEEFRAIGDLEGARSLAEEVLAEASGTLKTKASTFLADLS
ncbi:MAG: FimV/HubP family polar landmark protein [Gammaproteobacteria bacterium]